MTVQNYETRLTNLVDETIHDEGIKKQLLEIVTGSNYRWHNFIKDLQILTHSEKEKSSIPFENWQMEVVEIAKEKYKIEQRDNFARIFKDIAHILRKKNTRDREIYELIQAFERDRRLTLYPLEWDNAKLLKYLTDALDLLEVQIDHVKILGCVDEALSNQVITCFDAGSSVTRLIDAFKDEVSSKNYEKAVAENAKYIMKNNISMITSHENCGASALIFSNYIKPLLKNENFSMYFINPDEVARKFALDTIAYIKKTNPSYEINYNFIQASSMDRPIYEHIAAGITITPGEIIKAMYEANPKYPYTFNVDTNFPLKTVELNIGICLGIAFGPHGRIEEYLKQPFVIAIVGKNNAQTNQLKRIVVAEVKKFPDKPIKIIWTDIPEE
jgi:hypothetical protein